MRNRRSDLCDVIWEKRVAKSALRKMKSEMRERQYAGGEPGRAEWTAVGTAAPNLQKRQQEATNSGADGESLLQADAGRNTVNFGIMHGIGHAEHHASATNPLERPICASLACHRGRFNCPSNKAPESIAIRSWVTSALTTEPAANTTFRASITPAICP